MTLYGKRLDGLHFCSMHVVAMCLKFVTASLVVFMIQFLTPRGSNGSIVVLSVRQNGLVILPRWKANSSVAPRLLYMSCAREAYCAA